MAASAGVVVRGQDCGAVGPEQLQIDVFDVAVRVADDCVDVVRDAGVEVDLEGLTDGVADGAVDRT